MTVGPKKRGPRAREAVALQLALSAIAKRRAELAAPLTEAETEALTFVRFEQDPLRPLTDREQLFVAHYIGCNTAKEAARRSGVSVMHADVTLNDPAVALAIKTERTKQLKQLHLNADEVLMELARVGMSSVKKLFRDDGTLKLPHELDDSTAATIASIDVIERPTKDAAGNIVIEVVRKMRMHDKIAALTVLAKVVKILDADVLVNLDGDLADAISEARKRMRGPAATPALEHSPKT